MPRHLTFTCDLFDLQTDLCARIVNL